MQLIDIQASHHFPWVRRAAALPHIASPFPSRSERAKRAGRRPPFCFIGAILWGLGRFRVFFFREGFSVFFFWRFACDFAVSWFSSWSSCKFSSFSFGVFFCLRYYQREGCFLFYQHPSIIGQLIWLLAARFISAVGLLITYVSN